MTSCGDGSDQSTEGAQRGYGAFNDESEAYIKIADMSELGWKVVEEYEANEHASGSEDEKKLERAERTAERKAAKKQKATGKQGPRNYIGRF